MSVGEAEGTDMTNKLQYNKWYWDWPNHRPVFALAPYTSTKTHCLIPTIKPLTSSDVGFKLEAVKNTLMKEITCKGFTIKYYD